MTSLRLCFAATAALALCFSSQPPTSSAEEPSRPARTTETVARGKELYAVRCAKCHGPEGKGDGAERGDTLPRPRDFTAKQFKYVTTENHVPSAGDLFRTISLGLPGTAMKGVQEEVPEPDRWALAYYVQELAQLELDPKPLAIPARPETDDKLIRKGSRLFLMNCTKCHGQKGLGDGTTAETLKDANGDPILPRNLVADPLRGGDAPEQIFCRLKLGLKGSPMDPPEAFPLLKDDEAWALVAYVLSLRAGK